MTKDILIIGCGPAGLYAWKLATDLGLNGLIVENHATYGGQVTKSYPEKVINNLPAILEIKARDAIDLMFQAVNKETQIEVKFNTSIKSIKLIKPKNDVGNFENWFEVILSNKSKYIFKSIIFADGIGSSTPKRLVEENYDNISYTVTNIKKYENKDVLIFGGGDAALDWANEIAPLAKSVKIIHRRVEFRAKEASLRLCKEQGVELITPYKFIKISKLNKNFVKEIELKSTTKTINLGCDEIIVQFGYNIFKSKFENLNLEINKRAEIIVDTEMSTNVSGIFAIGDCCKYPNRIRNIVSCVYEAMQAVINIEKILKVRKKSNNGW